MLSAEENLKITRVGPDAPAGKLLRRYWLPACLSSELPEKDGEIMTIQLVVFYPHHIQTHLFPLLLRNSDLLVLRSC